MIPLEVSLLLAFACVPRVGGGDPELFDGDKLNLKCSPRRRG